MTEWDVTWIVIRTLAIIYGTIIALGWALGWLARRLEASDERRRYRNELARMRLEFELHQRDTSPDREEENR